MEVGRGAGRGAGCDTSPPTPGSIGHPTERRAAVDEIVRGAAAADPEIGALWNLGRDQRFAGQAELLRIVVGATGLRDGLDIESAADILYAIGSPDVCQLLVVD
jgi:hypothetical protein